MASILGSGQRYTIILHWYSVGVLGNNFTANICGHNAHRNCGHLIRSCLWWRVVWRSQGHVGVLCPAEAIVSTDDEDPYSVTGTVEIQDVTGTLQIYYQSTNVFGSKTNFDTLLPISVNVTKKSNPLKKRCLTSDQSDWTKNTQLILNCHQKGTRYK